MQSENNRNMIIAIVLSVVVLFGWQFFVAGPQLERAGAAARGARSAQQQAQRHEPRDPSPGQAATPSMSPAGVTAGSFADRASRDRGEPARQRSTRRRWRARSTSPAARIDDLQLKRYTETVDPNSPIITLLVPSGAPGGYYVEQGWIHPDGSNTGLPTATTQWTIEGANQTLGVDAPVTLRLGQWRGPDLPPH